MTTRYFNWKLALILIMAAGLLTGMAYALHRWQISTRAEQALPLGEKAYAQQNWDEAAVQLGRYLAVNNTDVEVLLKYARAQLKRRPVASGNIQQAVAAFRSALRLDSSNADATRRLTEVYLERGVPGEAELIAGRYLKEHDDPVIRRLLALALMRQRKFTESAAELNRIVVQDPNQVLAYEMMGLLADQRPEDVNKPAAFWFDEAVAQNPESALAYIVRAGFYRLKNDRARALADLEQAQKCDLSQADVRLRLVQELMDANVLDQARDHLTALQAENPADLMLWRNWAELASRLNSPDEMFRVAETGLKELAAQPWDFLPVATELYIRSNHLEQARDLISQMQQKELLPQVVAYLDGLLAEKQGKLPEAIAAWRKAVSLGYRSASVHLLLSAALARQGSVSSAINELRLLISDHPNHVEGHMALARLLAQAREWEEALDESRQVERLSPGRGDAILLGLQARAHMLAAAQGGGGREKAWQDIEERLDQLDLTSNGALPVKLLQAQIAVIRGKFSEAESLLTQLEAQYPSETSLALLHAEMYASQGKEQEAIARFRDIMEKFPQAPEPVRSLALVLDRQNKRGECESLLRQAVARLEQPRARQDLALLLAEMYRRWEQPDKLYQWLTELAAQSPNDITLKRQLLTCRQVRQDRQRAQQLVDEIRTLEGEKGRHWRYEQARVWATIPDVNEFKKRYYPQAVKLLQENLLANADDQASRMVLAAIHERAGDLPAALVAYREALARSPENVRVLISTVAALHKAQEFGEAHELLDRAAQRGLEDPDLLKLRLQNDLARGELSSASDILQGFIGEDPNNMSYSMALALIRIQEKDFATAQKILDELQAKTPDSASVIATQIRLQVVQGHAEDAIRLCDEAIKNLNNAFAYRLRAQTYASLRQNDKAQADFAQALNLEPKNADLWVARSNFYSVLGRRDNALADIRQARALAPTSLPIQKRAIALFLASGQPALVYEAQSAVEKALAVAPDDMQLRLFQARVLLLKGTNPATERARLILDDLTEKHPKYAEAWEWRARLSLQQGESGRAVEMALRGLTHNPENRQLLLLKALAEKESSPMSAALTLKGLADQYPDDVEVLVELADAYVRADRSAQATELLRQRLPSLQGPGRRRAEMVLAAVLYRSGQREDARVLFRTLLQAEPNDPAPAITWAQLLGREKRWSELNQLITQWRNAHSDDTATMTALASALAGTGEKDALQMAEDLLRVTLERDPKSIPSLMLLGMLMQTVGRSDESAALNRRILELDPNNIIAMNNLAWVLCEDKGQCEEALPLAQKGLAIDPEYKDLVDTRGAIFYRLGDYEKAAADFARCLELYPARTPAAVPPRFHLARAYLKMGRKTQAADQLRQVLREQESTGGLSPEDLAEARLLLEQLEKGNP